MKVRNKNKQKDCYTAKKMTFSYKDKAKSIKNILFS